MRTVLVLVAIMGQALAQAPQPARVEGRVTTPEGKPVARAMVRLSGTSPGPGRQPVTYVEVTAADGTFAVESIEPGTYMPSVNRQGYVVPGSPNNPTRPNPISVAQGQRVSNIDLKLTQLASVSGEVTDGAGGPIPGVTVRLVRYSYVNGNLSQMSVNGGQTDEGGRFRLPNVQPGRYYIAASANPIVNTMTGMNKILGRSAQEADLTTYYPGSAEIRGATMITVGSEPIENLRFRMLSGRTYSIRGTVSGLDGSSIQRPLVGVYRTGEMGGPGPFTSVQPDGKFEVKGVSPGEYTLTARVANAANPGAVQLQGRTVVRVTNGSVEGVTLALSPGASLTGQLSIEGVKDLKSYLAGLNAGRIVPNAPPGVTIPRGPIITLNPVDINGNSMVTVTTEEDGALRAQGLQAMEYVMNVSNVPPGTYVKQVRLNGQDITRKRFDVSAGGDAVMEILLSPKSATLSLTLPAEFAGVAMPVAPGGGITGVVPSPVGIFSPGLGTGMIRTYTIWPVTPNLLLTSSGVMVAGVGGGTARMQGLAPGEYYVAFWEEAPSEFVNVPDFLAKFNAVATRVTLREGETTTVEPAVILKDAARKAVAEFP
ncbi:MAG: hypothetical protein RL328_1548 [Acidobacteriota bacterium]